VLSRSSSSPRTASSARSISCAPQRRHRVRDRGRYSHSSRWSRPCKCTGFSHRVPEPTSAAARSSPRGDLLLRLPPALYFVSVAKGQTTFPRLPFYLGIAILLAIVIAAHMASPYCPSLPFHRYASTPSKTICTSASAMRSIGSGRRVCTIHDRVDHAELNRTASDASRLGSNSLAFCALRTMAVTRSSKAAAQHRVTFGVGITAHADQHRQLVAQFQSQGRDAAVDVLKTIDRASFAGAGLVQTAKRAVRARSRPRRSSSSLPLIWW